MGMYYVTNPKAQQFITGGAGFIGSHTAVVLLEADDELLVFDDFSNSSPIALSRVRKLAGPAAPRLRQLHVDICNPRDLEEAITREPSEIDAVIHLLA